MQRQIVVNVNSIQEMVYQSLRSDIIELVLKPGTVMSTQEVSARLNVSRTPVREAFIRLAREGLVDVEPQRGTVVSLIDLDRVRQERFLRETLEVANLRLFFQSPHPMFVAEQRLNLLQQKDALVRRDYMGFVGLDNAFHRAFFEAAHSTLCAQVLSENNGHYDRIRLITTWSSTITQGVLDQHAALLDRIEADDAAGALEIMKRHLHKLSFEEKDLVAQWPDYFTNSGENDAL